jgi:predicted acetyltransferase
LDSDAVVWVGNGGADEGYAVYLDRAAGSDGQGHDRREIFIHELIALTPDAYLGLWEHMLTHDLADKIITETHPDDRFQQLVEDPFRVEVASEVEGAMLRIVDVQRALEQRPSVGARPAGFTARIEDRNLPWNDGVWRIEAAEGRTSAERTEVTADVEMSVNALAALFTGFTKPAVAHEAGFVRVNRPEAVEEMAQVFAVNDLPHCPDWY